MSCCAVRTFSTCFLLSDSQCSPARGIHMEIHWYTNINSTGFFCLWDRNRGLGKRWGMEKWTQKTKKNKKRSRAANPRIERESHAINTHLTHTHAFPRITLSSKINVYKNKVKEQQTERSTKWDGLVYGGLPVLRHDLTPAVRSTVAELPLKLFTLTW